MRWPGVVTAGLNNLILTGPEHCDRAHTHSAPIAVRGVGRGVGVSGPLRKPTAIASVRVPVPPTAIAILRFVAAQQTFRDGNRQHCVVRKMANWVLQLDWVALEQASLVARSDNVPNDGSNHSSLSIPTDSRNGRRNASGIWRNYVRF